VLGAVMIGGSVVLFRRQAPSAPPVEST
jgi:hypothetical protein